MDFLWCWYTVIARKCPASFDHPFAATLEGQRRLVLRISLYSHCILDCLLLQFLRLEENPEDSDKEFGLEVGKLGDYYYIAGVETYV